MQYPHILQVPGNKLGRDFIGTDPHGCLPVLLEVTGSLAEEPHDRLFLCGDLIDRDVKNSYALLQHLDNEIKAQKNIFLIRGNHEDMVLRTLKFLDVMDVIAEMNERVESNFDDCKDSIINARPFYFFLENLRLRDCIGILDIYNAFCEDFHNKIRGDCLLSRTDVVDYVSEMRDLFHAESVISEMFSYFALHIYDGGAWVLDLDLKGRAWVQSFIEPLPYMIRVAAVQQGDEYISAFDIVHAAPLSETAIEQALLKSCPTLTDEQIYYMTWARPPEKCKENDVLMITNGRTPGSSRTYVGHNIFSACYPIYQKMNVFALDVATFFTGHMLIADHANNTILKIALNGCLEPKKYKSYYIDTYNALEAFAESLPSFVENKQELCNETWLFFQPPRKNSSCMSDDEDLEAVEKLVDAFALLGL